MNLNFTPQFVEVDCKEWNLENGEKILVKEPTAGEYALYESITAKLHWDKVENSEKRKIYARIAILFCYNAQNNRIFSEDDLVALTQGNSKPLRRIAMKVLELCNLEETESDELEKN
jgi:hypothetical protein